MGLGGLPGAETEVTICDRYGWHEGNAPICAGCGCVIGVRGEAGVAVLGGEVLECRSTTPGQDWFAHFHCRTTEWHLAHPTGQWWVRTLGERTYILLTSRPGWAEKEPEIAYCRTVPEPEP